MDKLLIDNLGDLRKSAKRCVLLYSGGIDSSYFLLWAKKNNFQVTALHVQLDPEAETGLIQKRAEALGADFVIVDGVVEFSEEYLSQAIYANAQYQQHFPICSALSRPLMSRIAVDLARQRGIECIVHTSTFVQNSCPRFNNSIRVLDPGVRIANPFIKEPIQRQEKLSALQEAGVEIEASVYSIDENIWGRVIECGELDDPGYIVPEHVFKWSGDATQDERRLLTLGFDKGLPVSIDGCQMSLLDIILALRGLGSSYRIGRYNGLEDTELGTKNHEVRESPAAALLFSAHMALERAILNRDELRVKAVLEAEWSDLLVRGVWYSSLREAISLFMARLNERVSGEVVLSLEKGSVMASAIRSETALHFWNASKDGVAKLNEDFSYKEFFEIKSFSSNH
jgi:argininosuccinate synthase